LGQDLPSGFGDTTARWRRLRSLLIGDKNVLYSIRATVYRSATGWSLLHLEAVHEAVTSDVAAGRRSGSYSAVGRRNLLS
jgi:hypothetical protein